MSGLIGLSSWLIPDTFRLGFHRLPGKRSHWSLYFALLYLWKHGKRVQSDMWKVSYSTNHALRLRLHNDSLSSYCHHSFSCLVSHIICPDVSYRSVKYLHLLSKRGQRGLDFIIIAANVSFLFKLKKQLNFYNLFWQSIIKMRSCYFPDTSQLSRRTRTVTSGEFTVKIVRLRLRLFKKRKVKEARQDLLAWWFEYKIFLFTDFMHLLKERCHYTHYPLFGTVFSLIVSVLCTDGSSMAALLLENL